MKTSVKFSILLIAAIILLSAISTVSAADQAVKIYFFHREGCPHCAAEQIYLKYLKDDVYKKQIDIIDYELLDHPENIELAETFMAAYGVESDGIPLTFIGTHYISGYGDDLQMAFRSAVDEELEKGPIDAMDIVNGTMTLSRIPASEVVNIYFFRGEGCSHCAAEEPFLQHLIDDVYQAKINIHEYEIWYNEENAALAEHFAEGYGQTQGGVPMTFIGTHFITGFSEDREQEFIDAIEEELAAGPVNPKDIADGVLTIEQVIENREKKTEELSTTITVPLFGKVDLKNKSLLVTTIIIGLVDGVNPCSLWVLTMLLAMVIHTDSRKKTLVIGFVYLFITAAIYALFILGVFSLLSYVRFMKWIQIAVACVTLILGLINLKDYFFFKQGVSLTIDDEKKPGLYKKMRNVLKNTDNVWAMIGATIVLSAGVSLVEFSCTAAFPVIWSNILSAHGIGKLEFALHLLLYMLLYQLDELIIFLVVVVTMKSKRMEEKHGQVLKLFSGCLMVVLSAVMIIKPALMNELTSTLIIFGASIAVTLLILLITAKILPKFGIYIGHMKNDQK